MRDTVWETDDYVVMLDVGGVWLPADAQLADIYGRPDRLPERYRVVPRETWKALKFYQHRVRELNGYIQGLRPYNGARGP